MGKDPLLSGPAPLSAPDLIGGPYGIQNPSGIPVHLPTKRRFHQVVLQVDLAGAEPVAEPVPFLDRLRAVLHDQRLREREELYVLASGVLHALGAVGLGQVTEWSLLPQGHLDLPPGGDHGGGEALNQVLGHLRAAGAAAAQEATGLTASLAGGNGLTAKVIVREVHPRRRHALTLTLEGTLQTEDLHRVEAALRKHLPVLRTTLESYSTQARRH
jgi:hypothetical protein